MPRISYSMRGIFCSADSATKNAYHLFVFFHYFTFIFKGILISSAFLLKKASQSVRL